MAASIPGMSILPRGENTPAGRNGGGLSEEDRKLIVRDLKREKNLDILFSEEEEVKKSPPSDRTGYP